MGAAAEIRLAESDFSEDRMDNFDVVIGAGMRGTRNRQFLFAEPKMSRSPTLNERHSLKWFGA
jgi:hypothetical protein